MDAGAPNRHPEARSLEHAGDRPPLVAAGESGKRREEHVMVAEQLVGSREEAASRVWADPRAQVRYPRSSAETRSAVAPLFADATSCPAVLVVDDDPFMREMLREVLERDGRLAVVGEARDGHAAVAAAEIGR